MSDSINVSLQVETVSKFKRYNTDQKFRNVTGLENAVTCNRQNNETGLQ
jgi:hypothetical protein